MFFPFMALSQPVLACGAQQNLADIFLFFFHPKVLESLRGSLWAILLFLLPPFKSGS